MLISVITPVYNSGNFLAECIESILNQRMSDFELLLIDDGSTDRSGALCDHYSQLDGRVRVLHTPNRGVSAARNLGLEQARGEFIVFIDSDDWVAPDHLCQFAASGIGEGGIAFSNLTEEKLGRSRSFPMPDRAASGGREACQPIITELIRLRCFGWSVNKMFSRATIERYTIRFNPAIQYAEDEIFTAEYCTHITHIVCNSRSTYHYRFVPTSLLHCHPDPMMIMGVRQLLLQHYRDLGYGDEILYITARTQFSRLRGLLRHNRGWRTENSNKLAAGILENWDQFRRYGCSQHRREFYDLKTVCLGWLICAPGSLLWAKVAVKGLRL